MRMVPNTKMKLKKLKQYCFQPLTLLPKLGLLLLQRMGLLLTKQSH